MRDDDCGHAGGVGQEVIKFLKVPLPIGFFLDVLRVVV